MCIAQAGGFVQGFLYITNNLLRTYSYDCQNIDTSGNPPRAAHKLPAKNNGRRLIKSCSTRERVGTFRWTATALSIPWSGEVHGVLGRAMAFKVGNGRVVVTRQQVALNHLEL